MSIHYAKPAMRDTQIKVFYGSLEKTARGGLSKTAKARWIAWLKAFDIGETRAMQIVSGKDGRSKEARHTAMASRYAEFLRARGYVVTEPKE